MGYAELFLAQIANMACHLGAVNVSNCYYPYVVLICYWRCSENWLEINWNDWKCPVNWNALLTVFMLKSLFCTEQAICVFKSICIIDTSFLVCLCCQQTACLDYSYRSSRSVSSNWFQWTVWRWKDRSLREDIWVCMCMCLMPWWHIESVISLWFKTQAYGCRCTHNCVYVWWSLTL